MMASPAITLRQATLEDAAFLNSVYTSTRADELAAVPWSDDQKRAFTDHQFAAQANHYREHYPEAQYLIIECEGISAGRLYVDRWDAEIRIMDIALLPGHRRLGVGTRLIQYLQVEAAVAGKLLSIHVEKNNPALQLYERLGFHAAGDIGSHWLMHWISAQVPSQ